MADTATKLVVGLGNPGAKYDGTRHNVGFEVLNQLHQRWGSPLPTTKFEGQIASHSTENGKVLLVWPMTFMNLSGRCVSAVAKFFKVNVEQDIMVICDDLSLPTGKIRIRPKGSAGGQKGLNDILQSLRTQEVPRLRIGIDQAPPRWETADYVLGKFSSDEQELISESVKQAADAIEEWLQADLNRVMNKHN